MGNLFFAKTAKNVEKRKGPSGSLIGTIPQVLVKCTNTMKNQEKPFMAFVLQSLLASIFLKACFDMCARCFPTADDIWSYIWRLFRTMPWTIPWTTPWTIPFLKSFWAPFCNQMVVCFEFTSLFSACALAVGCVKLKRLLLQTIPLQSLTPVLFEQF